MLPETNGVSWEPRHIAPDEYHSETRLDSQGIVNLLKVRIEVGVEARLAEHLHDLRCEPDVRVHVEVAEFIGMDPVGGAILSGGDKMHQRVSGPLDSD